jgi:hypothetical protein
VEPWDKNMTELQLSRTYQVFLNLLEAEDVDYLLVGGFAVQYFGYNRETQDLDIWIGTSVVNTGKMLKVIQDFLPGQMGLSPDIFRDENRIIRIVFPPARIEILNPIIGQQPDLIHQLNADCAEKIEILTVQSGLTFNQSFTNRIVDFIAGIQVNIINLSDLKTAKRTGNRPKDLEDLRNLEETGECQ